MFLVKILRCIYYPLLLLGPLLPMPYLGYVTIMWVCVHLLYFYEPKCLFILWEHKIRHGWNAQLSREVKSTLTNYRYSMLVGNFLYTVGIACFARLLLNPCAPFLTNLAVYSMAVAVLVVKQYWLSREEPAARGT